MEEQKIKLVIGTILHDLGKVVFRAGDGRNHSASGFEFIKEECNIEDSQILDCIKYHHAKDIKSAKLDKNNLAYISYIADNMSSMADRREDKDHDEFGFMKEIALSSVFNILNDNRRSKKYEPKLLNHEEGINLPQDEPNYTSKYYSRIKADIREGLKGIYFDKKYLESLLQILESYLTYVPSSTNLAQIQDISLYDHLKLTGAMASCIYDYFQANHWEDYSVLFSDSKHYYDEEMFYLYSLDLSGIQSFIYTIVNSKALKSLRTRSFYLEIFMEDIIDTILEELRLTRANLLYSGGGHAYLLLANTDETKEKLARRKEEINDWLVDLFGSELYLAGGGKECSANTLSNQEEKSYTNLFKSVSQELSKNKLSRYTLGQLKKLNFTEDDPGSRECKVCKRVDMLKEIQDQENICDICEQIIKFSNEILYQEFFAIVPEDQYEEKAYLPLPFGRKLLGFKKNELTKDLKEEENIIRIYSKNETHTGKNLATNLWVGDYSFDQELRKLNENVDGINRLAVLRADVDDLGKAFVQGFKNTDRSLTRSAVFSRDMSLFFKYHINYILEHGIYSIDGKEVERRRTLIVYSGGDDVFLVGAWRDVIETSIDLRNYLKEFTIDSLTISAGIGIYANSYPIKAMAEKTGSLEDSAKNYTRIHDGQEVQKNAVCIFEEDLSFSWDEFEYKVLDEKLKFLLQYYDQMDDVGSSLIYKLIQLLRNSDDKINIARLAYLLARLEERMKRSDPDRLFSKNIYRWARSDEKKQLIAAIYILIYLRR